MTTYGVCSRREERCSLSYEANGVERLLEMLRVIHAREREGRPVPEGLNSQLDQFRRFFQTGTQCSECGQPLESAIQPTTGLPPGGEEYERTVRVNDVLGLVSELQSRGTLAF